MADGRMTARAVVVVTVAAIGIVAAAGAGVVYAKGPAPPPERPIRSDGLSYYLYLPAVLVDHDLSFRRTLDRDFGGSYHVADLVPKLHGYLDKHPPGEAMLLLPFFAVGQLAASATGADSSGFSRPYQVAAVAGAIAYALAGLALVGVTLLRWFDRSVVVIVLVTITFGTNLFHYATYDAVYSHVFSFALVALIVERSLALAEEWAIRSAVVLGAALGLLAEVRLTNLTVATFPLLLLLASRRRLAIAATTSAVGALVFLPQVLYWYRITGHPFANAYGGSPTLRPLHPHLVDVAFSVRKGLFFWTPLLAIAVAGIWWLRRVSRPLAVATAATLILHFWIVASWTEWFYGGSLGQRAFVDVLPVFALGLGAAVSAAVHARSVHRYATGVAVAATTLLAAHATLEYWLGNIPPDLTTWDVYLHSFKQI